MHETRMHDTRMHPIQECTRRECLPNSCDAYDVRMQRKKMEMDWMDVQAISFTMGTAEGQFSSTFKVRSCYALRRLQFNEWRKCRFRSFATFILFAVVSRITTKKRPRTVGVIVSKKRHWVFDNWQNLHFLLSTVTLFVGLSTPCGLKELPLLVHWYLIVKYLNLLTVCCVAIDNPNW